MANIEEIFLDSQDNQPETVEVLEDIPEEIPEPAAVIEELPKKAKAKGRPAGAKNKQPAKPRVKKVTIQEPIAVDPPPYEPTSPRRNLPIPEYGASDVAVEMLRLLAVQQQAKRDRKRQLYASWFS